MVVWKKKKLGLYSLLNRCLLEQMIVALVLQYKQASSPPILLQDMELFCTL